ncbi:MAG: ABC transporter permease [Pseudoflavonifractor sp.]|nr:ABC transporter permease [Pseudoflavonifractor sp.]
MNYTRLSLIIKREYLSMVAKKSFLIMTLLIPVLMVAIGLVPVMLSRLNSSDEAKKVAVIDESGVFGRVLTDSSEFDIALLDGTDAAGAHDYYSGAGGEIYAIVIIPRDVLESKSIGIYSEDAVSKSLVSQIKNDLEPALTEARIESYGVDGLADMIRDCSVDLDVRSVKWNESGEESLSSTDLSILIGIVLSFIIYMFVLMYGAMIINSVVEEKSNRIVEVIVSSCKPFELMLGKIIGVGLVGLTQIAIWVVLIGGVSLVAGISLIGPRLDTAAMMSGADMSTATPDKISEIWEMLSGVNFAGIIGLFVLYFIGGYLLYASLFAGFGSAVDQASDASQFTMPIMIIIVFALYAGMACVDNPDGRMAEWCSFIPFTSPIVMMVRLPFNVPLWQTLVSLAILYATAIGCVYMSARIYRKGILLYGKRRGVSEVFKWIVGK